MTEPLFQNFSPRIVTSDWADRVITGAYNAMTPADRHRVAEDNPYSYLNVTRSPGDDPVDQHQIEDLLALGKQSLQQLFDVEAFADGEEGLLLYRLTLGSHSQTGIVGLMPIEAAHDGRIRKHEDVRPARAELLARHLEVVGAASSPVALAHRTDPQLEDKIQSLTDAPPTLQTSAGGVDQTVWKVGPTESATLRDLLQNRTFYITDGHHRFAAAAVAAGRHEAGSPYHRVLVVSFPTESMRVLPFHRRVSHLNGMTPAQVLERLTQVGQLTPLAAGIDSARPSSSAVSVYVDGGWHRLDLGESDGPPLARLGVSVLQNTVLEPILGITEPNADPTIEFVADPVGIEELVRRCDADGGIAFIVPATTIDEIMTVADSNGLMPPKSSYFDPKPRSGIFLRVLEDG